MELALTITFGDVAENHVGQEQIGTIANEGLSLNDLKIIGQTIGGATLHFLGRGAGLLIVRNGVRKLLGSVDELEEELFSLDPDKKYYDVRRKKVLNKHARYNLCFADEGHDADYENAQGTVMSFVNLPYLAKLRRKIGDLLPSGKLNNLNAEGNYYYSKKCGIGYHGDTERKIVVGVRLGREQPIYFRWYQHSNPIGDRKCYDLSRGDIYIMSEKAVGCDWKKRSIPTLRHATGAEKYVT
jgi:hypothetical protein